MEFFFKNPKKCQDKKGLWWCCCCSRSFPLLLAFSTLDLLPPQRACWEESLKGEVIMNEPVLTCTITIVSLVWFDLGIGWAFLQKNHHFGKKKLPFEKPNILSLFFFPS
jgi:hypothetical protein